MKVICLRCKIEFNVKPYVIRHGGGKYCSLSCAAQANINNLNKANEARGSVKRPFVSVQIPINKPINNNPSIEERKAIALAALANMGKSNLFEAPKTDEPFVVIDGQRYTDKLIIKRHNLMKKSGLHYVEENGNYVDVFGNDI